MRPLVLLGILSGARLVLSDGKDSDRVYRDGGYASYPSLPSKQSDHVNLEEDNKHSTDTQRDWAVVSGIKLGPAEHTPSGCSDGKACNMRAKRKGMQLEFLSMGHKFILETEENRALIGSNEIHASADLGRVLIGKRLHVERDGQIIDVVDNPLARLYILNENDADLGEPLLRGGFRYGDHFYRLRSPTDPTLPTTINRKVLARKIGSGAKRPPRTILTRKLVASLHETPDGEKRKYKCGSDNLPYNRQQAGIYTKPSDHSLDVFQTTSLQASPSSHFISPLLLRDRKKVSLAPTENCPVNPQQIDVAVVADCNYVKKLGGKSKARDHLLTEMNLASGIFLRTYNIDLSISSIELFETCNSAKDDAAFNVPCRNYPGLDVSLNRFSEWRGTQNSTAGIFHLVTSCNYSDTVGLAWVNQVCRTGSFTDSTGDVISGTSVSVLIDYQFSVIAHELAHNFGAIHDCQKENCNGECEGYLDCQCCPCGKECDCKGKYIMNPESGGLDATDFSTCTIQDVCDKLPFLAGCLYEPGSVKTSDLTAVCGNGIREGNEECDCGGKEGCAKTSCCTIDCKLADNATCYDGNDLCCRDCQVIPASSNQICRVATNDCQLDVMCDGKSSSCPVFTVKADGTNCGNDKGDKCASGLCTSRHGQCGIFGRHLNITKACPYTKRSCTMICQGLNNQCVDMSATFIDGTPCGDKGVCRQGMCSEFASGASILTDSLLISWLVHSARLLASLAAAAIVALI